MSELNQAWESPVKKKLREGEPVVAATITAASVEVAAQIAGMGFDFLWIEMEHSPVTLETLRTIVLATRGLKALPFARVPVNELWTEARSGCGRVRRHVPVHQHAGAGRAGCRRLPLPAGRPSRLGRESRSFHMARPRGLP